MRFNEDMQLIRLNIYPLIGIDENEVLKIKIKSKHNGYWFMFK